MKSSRKIIRHQIENNVLDDFFLLGIVSADPDYKLSLRLNKVLKLSLKSATPIRLDGNDEDSVFSRFAAESASNHITYNLVANRSGNNYFISRLRNIDYILQVIYNENRLNIDEITSRLRETESITAVFNISPDSLKDKNLEYLIH